MLEQLDSEINQYQFSLQVIRNDVAGILVCIKFSGNQYQIVISDEFDDLSLNNPLMNYYLFRLSLDHFFNSTNYNEWSVDNEFDPQEELVKTTYNELKKMTLEHSELESYQLTISNYDYQLNTSEVESIRAYHKR